MHHSIAEFALWYANSYGTVQIQSYCSVKYSPYFLINTSNYPQKVNYTWYFSHVVFNKCDSI